MKFAKSLLRNEVPEWSSHYIDYKQLKKLIKQVSSQQADAAAFFYALDRNLELVDSFYNHKFAEFNRRLSQIDLIQQSLNEEDADEFVSLLIELRNCLRNLQWYAEVNKQGFLKILKKFDKKNLTQQKSQYMASKIQVLSFYNGADLAGKVTLVKQLLNKLSPETHNKAQTPLPGGAISLENTQFDLVKAAIDSNDVVKLQTELETVSLTPKQVCVLITRAVVVNSDNCIPILAQLELENDELDRNILHKVIISEGRRLVLERKMVEISAGVPKRIDSHLPVSNELSFDYDLSNRSICVLIECLQKQERLIKLATQTDHQLRTPLHYAARYGLAKSLELLLNFIDKSVLDFGDSDDQTPVDLSVLHIHPRSLKAMLKFNPLRRPNLLITASKLNAAIICETLIVDGKYDINFKTSLKGETALHFACKHNHLDCVNVFIKLGADLEVREQLFGWTPLFFAVVDGFVKVCTELLKAGASPMVLDNSGWSPKEHAALRGHLGLAKELPLPSSLKMPQGTTSIDLMRNTNNEEGILKTFGHRSLTNKDEKLVLVTLGSCDLRLKSLRPVELDNVPMSEAGNTQLDTALSLVVRGSSNSEPYFIDLPVPELGLATDPLPFYTTNLEQFHLVFDLVPTYRSADKPIARGVYAPPILKDMQNLNLSVKSVALIEAHTLRFLGKVNFELLIVKPFSHPRNDLSLGKTYWRSLVPTQVIGHRGLGKNTLANSSLQLGENTVESFIQAANLGAGYVEFDVQLTKDEVPVIYHDFLVGDSGFDIPMHAMTFDQFMNIHSSSKSVAPVKLKQRSKSVHEFVTDVDYNDALERMKYTRDFKLKGYKGNVRGMHIQSKFATLKELFESLPTDLGFNIEFKYPMLDEAEAEEMDGNVFEINRFVDKILQVVFDNKQNRDIIFSSFNPDVCILLALKQPLIPVLFLTEGGTAEMMDIRASSLQEAVRFAKRFNLLGIVSEAQPLIMCPRLVRAVKENGLVCFTYGTENNVPENARTQLEAGVDAVIVDSVLAIRRELTRSTEPTERSEVGEQSEVDQQTSPAERSEPTERSEVGEQTKNEPTKNEPTEHEQTKNEPTSTEQTKNEPTSTEHEVKLSELSIN